MPDQPIKHSQIIEQGNPFDDTIKGLEKMIKLLKQAAKDYLKFAQKQNTATKEGRKNIEAVTKATKKLSVQEKEALKVKRALEREQAKANLLQDESHRALIRSTEAQKQANRQTEKAIKSQAKGVKSTNRWNKALGSFAFKFNALGNIAANVFSSITLGLQRAIKDSIMLAAKAEGVTAAFRNLGRPGLLKELQKATRGTVDNLTLMQSAVQAKNFKIPLEKLGTFFDFATSRAIQTGESVDFLVNSIITGIGRKSVLVMDNLGISAVELQEEIKKVGDFGLASANIIERELREAGDVANTTATFIAQINTEWTNLKTNIGDSEIIMFFMRGLKAGFEDISRLLNRGDQTEALTAFVKFAETIKDKEPAEQAAALADEIKRQRKEIADTSKEYRAQIKLTESGRRVVRKFAETEIERIDEIQTKNIALLRVFEDQLVALEKESKAVGDVADETPALEDISDLVKNLKDELIIEEDGEESKSWERFWKTVEEGAKNALDKVLRDGDARVQQAIEETKRADAARAAEEKAAKEAEDLKQKKIKETFTLANKLTSTFTDIFAQQKAKELSAAGDNAEKRLEIEKKFAQKEQILAISQAVVDGAASILKTKASLGLPAAIPFMIADAAITAAQIGVIAAQKFGEGEVDIDGPSHAMGGIAAEIEGGESVINKRSTSKYGGLLEAINANDSAAIADAALHNSAFHEVWGRTRINETHEGYRDPYMKKLYEAYIETPTIIPDGPRTERYPNGRTRIING